MRMKFLMCLLAVGLGGVNALAQEPSGNVIFFQLRSFKIPFKTEQQRGIVEVRLYVSTDQGRHWQLTETTKPENQQFRFNTPTDGYFWFAVQTVDMQNKPFPPTDDLRANLRVVVDTVPPTVQVQALPARAGEVGVAWTVRDDNLDLNLPDALRVEYRPVGGFNWIPLAVQPGASQVHWNPQANGPLEVRVAARDRAGNLGEDKIRLQNGNGPAAPPFGNQVGAGGGGAFGDPDRKFVNQKQISLSYDLREVGPSGVSSVELWYTLTQGRSWAKLMDYSMDLKNAADARDAKKLTFEVNDEGVYGIALVAKSGVGLGERPPQPGDRPQFWIEVDLTRPGVQLNDVKVGTGFDKGKLTIDWKATDKNLGLTPIRLSYADDKAGPWTTIADKLSNTGRYIWRMPEPLPYQFYVKVEAIDRAGNVGEAVTLERVKVDLSQPKAKILDIAPGGQ
jgi:hypothetical protein